MTGKVTFETPALGLAPASSWDGAGSEVHVRRPSQKQSWNVTPARWGRIVPADTTKGEQR